MTATYKLVEAVIINWKRPNNVAKIITALKSQTEPCTITVCDCHPSPEFALDKETLASIDRLYRWSHNTGAYSRYVPVGAYDHRFTLFLDDDMLPGNRCVEHFIRSARQIGIFGVLGQQGRIVEPDGLYRPRDILRARSFIECDIIVRGYFVRTENLPYVLQFRWRMRYFDDPLPEDDLLLCTSLRVYARLPCYLTPQSTDPETLMNKRELSTDYALSRRADHLTKRQNFLRRAARFGWLSLNARGLNRNLQQEPGATYVGEHGILYLSLGTAYQELTVRSISLLRHLGYTGPIRVVTDTPGWNCGKLGYELVTVPSVGAGFGTRHYKTQINRYGFDVTLFLDSDAFPIAPIDDIWNEIRTADICMSLDLHPEVADLIHNGKFHRERRQAEFDLMIKLGLMAHPLFNSGVMLFRRCKPTAALFSTWHEEWNRFRNEDQLALVRAIVRTNINVRLLSSRWNHRPKGFKSLIEAQNAGIKILHFLSRQRPLLKSFFFDSDYWG